MGPQIMQQESRQLRDNQLAKSLLHNYNLRFLVRVKIDVLYQY